MAASIPENPDVIPYVDPCKGYLQDLAKISSWDYVRYAFATTQIGGEVVYADGLMKSDIASGKLVDTDCRLYFNDRSAGLGKPFDPENTEDAIFSINVNDCKATLSRTTKLGLLNYVFDLKYDGGLLYGSFTDSAIIRTMIVIATQKLIRHVHV